MPNVDEAWEDFVLDNYNSNNLEHRNEEENTFNEKDIISEKVLPKCSDIYISTKTQIAFLNQTIPLSDVFWKIPIIEYSIPREGIIKKQMKFNSLTPDELKNNLSNINEDEYCEHYILTHIENPTGRIKFKDIRKISIGLSKKDIISYRCKKKSAFYNCFVIIIRLKWRNNFREIHAKIFNTGKIEIPGIQSDELLNQVLDLIVKYMQPLIQSKIPLNYIPEKNETVLINSNFNCGFYINREKLFDLLRDKYHINSSYDPCSYPGIQCEFYYNTKNKVQSGQQPSNYKKTDRTSMKVSFMIFRTGSVLIVGKCDEDILRQIYVFIKNILQSEYATVGGENIDYKLQINKKKKIRKKNIIISS
jgi:hypothetical protein